MALPRIHIKVQILWGLSNCYYVVKSPNPLKT
jgi:hypothetical protein